MNDVMALTGYTGQHELMSPLEAGIQGFRVRKIDSSPGESLTNKQ